MDTQSGFGFRQLLTHMVSDMVRAVSGRAGETAAEQFARTQAAAHMIMGFQPRDTIEAMLAGHCVMFHALLADSIHATLHGEQESHRRATRKNIVALDTCFGNNLARLERYQARQSEGMRDEDAPPIDAQGDGARPAQTTPAAKPDPAETAPWDENSSSYQPSPEQIAACMANPEVMAALDAGDALAFARALGMEHPSEAFLAAAASRPDLFPPRDASARPANLDTPAAGDDADLAPPARAPHDGSGPAGPELSDPSSAG